MIFDMVIYVTLINSTIMECILLILLLKKQFISLIMCFRIFNFRQIKIIFCEMKTTKNCFIANGNV